MEATVRILSIETAVNVCSVCIADDTGILSLREETGVNNQSSRLSVFIDEIMKESGTEYSSLSAVAVSGGPGSYTGLRIGVSAAKGICYAAEIPLIAVDTLQAMALIMKEKISLPAEADYFLQPMIDARRMEVYTALYDKNLHVIKDVTAEIISGDYFSSLNTNLNIVLGGNGAFKCNHLVKTNNQIILMNENIHSSTGVAKIGIQKFKNKNFSDVAYYEPFYLKEFIPGKPKVKGLHD